MILRVGHTELGYQQAKNIVGKAPDCKYVLVRDRYSVLRRAHELFGKLELFASSLQDARFKFQDYGLNRVDLLHLYNGVSYASRPWMSTFETMLPRFRVALQYRLADPERVRADAAVRRAVERMAGAACKQLIVCSRNTLVMQQELLAIFPEYRDAIIEKIVVLPIAQPLYREKIEPDTDSAAADRPLRLMLVGHDFFRKGGREVLIACDALRRDHGLSLELIVVSGLGVDRYASGATQQDVDWVRQFITARSDWIRHYSTLPNADVHALMDSVDVGLLPSYAETYGFAVLEFQAHGVPVITTDIRSFPEINNEQCGWLISIPKRSDGEALYRDAESRARISAAIREGLTQVISEIAAHPAALQSRRPRALQRIADHHDPVTLGNKLRSLYVAALD